MPQYHRAALLLPQPNLSLLDCGWLQILDSGVYSAQTYFSADPATVGRNVCVCFPVLTKKDHGYLDVVSGHWTCGNTMVFSENTFNTKANIKSDIIFVYYFNSVYTRS